MIRRNFQLALDAQIKTSIEENNLLQSTIEYRLLDTINSSPSNLVYQMKNLSADVVGKMGGNNKGVYVFYDGAEVVHSAADDNKLSCPEELWSTAVIGQKQYMITKEAGRYYLFSCSTSLVQDKKMNIINARDITETYQLVENERRYFVLLLGIVVLCCTVAVFVITYLLTKPLETLNRASKKFGEGDYESRVHLRSHDEVGTLAQTYNQMADAVCEHMDELQGMVTRQEQFVADFTHEVKTPMTTIIGYADMLRSKEMKRENQVLAASYIFHEGKYDMYSYEAKITVRPKTEEDAVEGLDIREAEAKADAFLAKLGYDDFTCFETGIGAKLVANEDAASMNPSTLNDCAYCFSYTRTRDGIPVAGTPGAYNFTFGIANQLPASEEVITVAVDVDGVAVADIQSAPYDVEETGIGIESVLTLEQVDAAAQNYMQKFEKTNAYADVHKIMIDRVELNYVYVCYTDGKCNVIPIWAYYGSTREGGKERYLFGVSAVDGQIVEGQYMYYLDLTFTV